jgi:penicillin-binding protein 1A
VSAPIVFQFNMNSSMHRPSEPDSESEPGEKRSGLVGRWFGGIHPVTRWLVGSVIFVVCAVLCVAVAGALALAIAYPKLPDIASIQDYRPKLPLRVLSSEGVMLGEFGEERRILTPIKQFPQNLKNAVLAIEDASFYEHGGVDYSGIVRAALSNLKGGSKQGASTITMQTARSVFLSHEQTFSRKIFEILLTWKLESSLAKDEILEIYMNQIFLGNRAYGFAAAADFYYGKTLKDLTLAESAMLAGIPKFPSTANPVANLKRARTRQLYILERMAQLGYVSAKDADAAKQEPIKLRDFSLGGKGHGEYLAEAVRQLIYSQYGDEAYVRGLNVYTTIRHSDQLAAYKALRKGIMDYERRQAYRGPEKFYDLPKAPADWDEAIDDILAEHPDSDEIHSAVIKDVAKGKVTVQRRGGETTEISGDGLRLVQSALSDKAGPTLKFKRGAVVRIVARSADSWEIVQMPEVEGAFVSLNPQTGAVLSMVGGFDFQRNKFNHVTQAWRQPGSSFKPFIYSAGLEKGLSGQTVINDAPLFFDSGSTGSQAWEPKNYDGRFEGPMSMRRALAKSKNMVSIRVLQTVGAQNAQEWLTRFGFEPERHPAYLTMALGAGSVTPLQMASGYGVFANGGHLLPPALITRISDAKGNAIVTRAAPQLSTSTLTIDPRNAFVMTNLMQEITKTGTAAKAQTALKRPDIYGKTGTTNDSMDTWFVGYHPTVVAAVWMGYDNPRKLGDKETGGSLSLPVWISYMQHALKGVPVNTPTSPAGLIQSGADWLYEEYANGTGIRGLGLGDPVPSSSSSSGSDESGTEGEPAPPSTNQEEKEKILDMFKKP